MIYYIYLFSKNVYYYYGIFSTKSGNECQIQRYKSNGKQKVRVIVIPLCRHTADLFFSFPTSTAKCIDNADDRDTGVHLSLYCLEILFPISYRRRNATELNL